jgi:mannose-6-phosphate isomerase
MNWRPVLAGENLGKTEAWVIMDVQPTGVIYAGLKPGVTRTDLERHLHAGTLEQCLHAFKPSPGDCVFLPAGTVHAVGGGVVMAEVQQSSDATFRLYDWNRDTDGKPQTAPRERRSINWDAGL